MPPIEKEVDAPTSAPVEVPEVKIEVPKVDALPIPVKTDVTGPIIEQEVATSTDTESPVHSTLPVSAFPTLEPVSPPELTKQCEDGSHWDEIAGTCVPDAPTPSRVVSAGPVAIEYPKSDVTVEFKKLKLGEPFSGYTDHDDCVSKNQDKEDPDAYCADIKRKTEGDTATESTGNLYNLLSETDRKSFVRDVKNAEAINKLGETQALLIKKLDAIPNQVYKQVLTESRLRAKADNQTASFLKVLPNAIQKSDKNIADWTAKLVAETQAKSTKQVVGFMQNYVTETMKQVATTIMEYNQKLAVQTNQNLKNIMENNRNLATQTNRTVAASIRSLGQCSQANDKKILDFTKKVNEARLEDKKAFEKLLDIADKNAEARDNQIKTLEERLKEQQEHQCGENEHWSEEANDGQGGCVPNEEPPEVEELRKKVEELLEDKKNTLEETTDLAERVKTLEENAKASLRGKFKSETPVDKKQTSASYEEGLTPKKKRT